MSKVFGVLVFLILFPFSQARAQAEPIVGCVPDDISLLTFSSALYIAGSFEPTVGSKILAIAARKQCADGRVYAFISMTPDPVANLICQTSFRVSQNGVTFPVTLRTGFRSAAGTFCGPVPSRKVVMIDAGSAPFDARQAFRIEVQSAIGSPRFLDVGAVFSNTTVDAPRFPITSKINGIWWNPLRAGEGWILDVGVTGGRRFFSATQFGHTSVGQQWLSGSFELTSSTSSFEMDLARPTLGGEGYLFQPGRVVTGNVAFGLFTSYTCNHASMTVITGAQIWTVPLIRFWARDDGVTC